MTKTKKVAPVSKYQGLTFKVEETVLTTQPKSVPTNLAEEKERFIKYGKTPKFEVQDPFKLTELAEKTKNKIRFDLQGEAEAILEYVRNEYGDGNHYLDHAFGLRITKDEATPILLQYISENALSESLTIHWCDNLACSAKMVWRGPMVNCNRPELRKYSLWINGSDENNYLRESGIRCLMDHEIGTHFFRMLNDGFQPWFSERAKFGLRAMGSFEGQCTEEGLAAINTALRGRVKFLWGPALAYYTACKSAEMTFKQLFDHIGRYTSNPDLRWKQVMRVKRGLADPNDLGGFGNDQCYFEGAVTILRNMDNIDFSLLMSGKISYDEIDRIKRVVRKDCMRYPTFMHNMTAYRKALKKMATINGLDKVYPSPSPPVAYLKRLDERKAGISSSNKKSKKVRCRNNTLRKQTRKNAKGATDKSKEESGDDNIKSFAVTQPFINRHQLRIAAAKKEKETAALYQSFKDLSNNITCLDNNLDKKIKDLHEIVNGHSWSSSDSGYKKSLLSQASSELSSDSMLVDETLRTGSAMEDAVTAQVQYEEIRPRTSFMDYKSDQIPPEQPSLNQNKNSKPLKLSPISTANSDINNSPISTANSNINNSHNRKPAKKARTFMAIKKERTAPPNAKSELKNLNEPFTTQVTADKLNELRNKIQAQIRPDEIVVDLQESAPSLIIESPGGNITEGMDNLITSQNHSVNDSSVFSADFNSVKNNQEFSPGNVEENSACSAVPVGSSSPGHAQITPKTSSHSFVSDSMIKSVRPKLLERRGSMSSNTTIEPGFYFDPPTHCASDSNQSTPTPRMSRKKKPWAGAVSEIALRKPVAIARPKLDRKYLQADLCQPFFIQAERVLYADNILPTGRPQHNKLI